MRPLPTGARPKSRASSRPVCHHPPPRGPQPAAQSDFEIPLAAGTQRLLMQRYAMAPPQDALHNPHDMPVGEMTQVSRMHRTFERPPHLSAASNAAGFTTESVNTDEKLLRLQPPQNPPHWPPQVCPLVSHVICDMGPSPQVVQALAPPGIPNGVDVRSSCIGLPKPGGGHVQSVFAPKTVRSTTFTHCGMVENVASVRLTVTERLPGVRPLITLRRLQVKSPKGAVLGHLPSIARQLWKELLPGGRLMYVAPSSSTDNHEQLSPGATSTGAATAPRREHANVTTPASETTRIADILLEMEEMGACAA
eukprot:m.418465 g.418465  ORF g.418465 m.418465 type:complete len:308 (+) comp30955_c0_seq1:430-1353(+)